MGDLMITNRVLRPPNAVYGSWSEAVDFKSLTRPRMIIFSLDILVYFQGFVGYRNLRVQQWSPVVKKKFLINFEKQIMFSINFYT